MLGWSVGRQAAVLNGAGSNSGRNMFMTLPNFDRRARSLLPNSNLFSLGITARVVQRASVVQ